MIDLFKIPAGDQSIFYLGQIFGYVGNVLPVNNAPLLLGTMFKVFNTMALVLGSLIVVYTTVVGLFATAAEGEFLGKKWSGLWVPLRMLLGIGALFPTSSGYSALQVIMMWCIIQGVGAADTVWTTVLNYLQIAGSPFASVNVPSIGSKQSIQQIFQGLQCQASARATYNKFPDATNAKFFCSDTSRDPFCTRSAPDPENPVPGSYDMLDVSATGAQVTPNLGTGQMTYGMGPGSSSPCGTVTYCNPADPAGNCKSKSDTSVGCAACKAQVTALQSVVSTLGIIAAQTTKTDYDYAIFYDCGSTVPNAQITGSPNACGASDPPPKTPDFVQAFCKVKSISLDQCCVKVPGTVVNTWTDNNPCVHADAFPKDYKDNPVDNTNTSIAAMQDLYWTYKVKPSLNGTDFINASTNYYTGMIVGAVSTAIAQTSATTLTDWRQDSQQKGWIMAGAYYYQIANISNNNLSAALPTLAVSTTDPSNSDKMSGYRTNWQSIQNLIDKMQSASQAASSFSSAVPPGLQKMSGVADDLIADFMKGLSGDDRNDKNVITNPLAKLQAYGESILIAAQVLFVVFLIASVVTATLANINGSVMGNWFNPGVGTGMSVMIFILLPLFLGFLGALFVFGGMLAVYVPLIPYILFTMAALGWFIGTVEAMMAAPLIALGILSPGGQHEVLGKAEPALLLLLNVVLRPSLMVFGMMIAMLFSGVAVTFVNAGFRYVIQTIFYSGTVGAQSGPAYGIGLPEFIMLLAAYTFLIMSVLNKCFSLIHLIPERVLTWIGGQAVSYGEEQALGEVKKGVESAGGAVMGAGKEALDTHGTAKAGEHVKEGYNKDRGIDQ